MTPEALVGTCPDRAVMAVIANTEGYIRAVFLLVARGWLTFLFTNKAELKKPRLLWQPRHPLVPQGFSTADLFLDVTAECDVACAIAASHCYEANHLLA